MQLLIIILLCLAGCSTTRQSPSFDRAYSYLDQASDSATGKTAEAIKKAKEQIIAADKACSANTQALDDAVKDKNEAIKDAEVWKQKQRKALKELWIYRGAIIALVIWTFRGVLFGGVMFVARKFVGVPW
jgi:predicted kinase